METSGIILSAVAIGISLLALRYSVVQGKMAQKHNRLSTKPILDFSLFVSAAHNRFSLIVENNGLGPAIVKSYNLLVDQKSFDELRVQDNVSDWSALSAFLAYPNPLDWKHILEGNVIKAGETIELVGYINEQYDAELASKFRQAVRRLTVQLEYTSIYEMEEFKADFVGVDEIQVED